MNDLQNATTSKPRLFADDTCIVVSNSSKSLLEQTCNSEMQHLKKWCDANELQINPNKSVIICIPPKLHESFVHLKVNYNDLQLTCVNSSKYLGVMVDNKLSFQSHINMIENKVARAVGILSKVRFLFPSSTLLLLYSTLIKPHLLFGITLWGSTCSSYLCKLQRLQNKAIRIISNCNRRASITYYYHKLEILKITDLYTFEIAKLMHQHHKQSLPLRISNFFKPLSTVYDRQTRSKTLNNLFVEKFSTSRCQKSIKFQGPKIWNSIASDLRAQPFRKFKISYKRLLINKYQSS